jgi:hypothetical protein
MPEGQAKLQQVQRPMQLNFDAMIGGPPGDCQPCRCHRVNSGVACQLEGFQSIRCNTLKAITTSHFIRYIQEDERKCSDSDHFSCPSESGLSPSARSEGSLKIDSRSGKAEIFGRVPFTRPAQQNNEIQFQLSTQPSWQKIPTRHS